MMKTVIALIFAVVSVATADDGPAVQVKRVSSVTWDPQTGRLSWVVQSGTEGTDGFAPVSEEHYEIASKESVMTSSGEKREFTSEQVTWAGDLLRALTAYCAASTIWWYRGGTLPPSDDKPTTSPRSDPEGPKSGGTPDTAPHKVTEPQNLKTPLMSPQASPRVAP
jgi:hypothetical protein